MTNEEMRKSIFERWFSPDFCWKCGNKGFWMEQIDGPDNLRKVYCSCGVAHNEGIKE